MTTKLISTQMERLDFLLPDFTRFIWVSDKAQEVWQPRLRRITTAWMNIEWLSVVAGVRYCGLIFTSPQDLISQGGLWVKHGLSALPLEIQGLPNTSYATTHIPAEPGKPFLFRVAIGTPDSVSTFKDAFDNNNEEQIGKLLGFPSCCTEFFEEVWVKQRLIDTTWPMAWASGMIDNNSHTIWAEGPLEANILWRWMSIRIVPHLPCKFNCQPTIDLAKQLMQVGVDAGYQEEIAWIKEILSWPIEWSALHGIAEIKTPILKVSARTDATAQKYIVRRKGTKYPPEGAQGLTFPYAMPNSPILVSSSGFRSSLENPVPKTKGILDWYASDNGFNSRHAMETAHQPIIKLATAVLSNTNSTKNIIDLGCGNGALLKEICKENAGVIPFGIEIQKLRAAHAHAVIGEFNGSIVAGDLFDCDLIWPPERRYVLAILMIGRLFEATAERVTTLKERLKQHVDHFLVYAYEDTLAKYNNDFQKLAVEAGISLINGRMDITACLAKI